MTRGASDAEERARAYFQKPGFRRLLKAVWKRYESLERAGGKAVVPEATAEECETVGGFIGEYYQPGKPIIVPLERFESELLDETSRFPFSLRELHVVLTGGPLLTKSEKRLLKDQKWLYLFEHIGREGGRQWTTFVSDWMKRLLTGQAQGYRTLRDIYNDDPIKAEAALQHAALALDLMESGQALSDLCMLPGLASIRLPVLAAKASGDPHALDWKEPAGRLLFYALRERTSRGALDETDDVQVDSLTVRDVYRSACIADDDLSSLVHMYVLSRDRPVEPTVLTLRQVELMEAAQLCGGLYVVENPSVFSTLLDITAVWLSQNGGVAILEPPPILICTSGPASAATLRFMQRCLVRSGKEARLFYSGDFDMQGITMGVTLAHRFGERFSPWRFDAATYEEFASARPGPSFSEGESYRLSKLAVSWDPALGPAISARGCKLFQECFLSPLVEDWLRMLPEKGRECT